MKKVFQTKFGKPDGNCFAACLASILELPIEEIPDYKQPEGRWFRNYRKWIKQYGLDLLIIEDISHEDFIPDVCCIVSGTSPRGLMHAVVYQGTEMIHDPHPEGGGVKHITDRIYLLSKDITISK